MLAQVRVADGPGGYRRRGGSSRLDGGSEVRGRIERARREIRKAEARDAPQGRVLGGTDEGGRGRLRQDRRLGSQQVGKARAQLRERGFRHGGFVREAG